MLRWVLIAAVFSVSWVSAQNLGPAERKLYDEAIRAQRSGDYSQAVTYYRKVLHARDTFVPAHLNLASAYLAMGEMERCEFHLRKSLALQPKNGSVLMKVASLYAQAGKIREAEKVFANVPKELQSTHDYLYTRGTIRLARGEPQRALEDLELAHKKSPNEVQTIFLLAALRAHLGKADEALQLLAAGSERMPKEPLLWQGLAEAYLSRGENDRAAEALEKARRLMPDNIEISVLLSRVYEHLDRTNDAVGVLADIIRIYPRNRMLRIEQGDVFARKEMWKEAEAQYLVARELSPRNPDIENRLATVAAKLGKTEVAKEQFEAVLLLDPKNTFAYLGLEELYLKAHAHAPLIRIYRQWMENVPEDPYPSRKLCEIYRQARDDAATTLEYERHLKSFPNDLEGLRGYALHSEATDRLGKALELYRRIVQLDPGDRHAGLSVGEVLIKMGRAEEGVKEFEKLIEKDPKDSAAWLALGSYYERSDQPEKAREVYERSLRSVRSEPVLAQLVRLLEKMGDIDGAVRVANDLLSTSKNPSADFAHIPSLLYRNGRKEEALRLWRDRIAQSPADATLRAGYAVMLLNHGDLEGAAAQYAEIKRLQPDNPHPRLKLAEIREQQKNLDLWIAELRELLRFAPDEPATYALFHRYYSAVNRPEGFWDDVAPFAEKGSPEDLPLQRLVEFAPRVGKEKEALEIAKKRVDSVPLSRGAWVALAKAHQNLGQYPEAIEAYGRACRMDPHNISAMRTYCLLAEEKGTPDQALAAYKLYSEHHPSDAWSLLKYANLLRQYGKPLEALDVFRKVLESFPDNETAKQAVKEIEEEITKPKGPG